VVTPQPELSDAEVEELLGAYALDACDPGETAAVEAVLARRPDLAAEAARLAKAAAWIGATEALEPPRALRAAVMGTTRPDPDDPTDIAVELYRRQSKQFEDAARLAADAGVLDELTTNGLTAYELVVHEAAQESLLAQAVGRSVVPEVPTTDIDARTHDFIALLDDRPLSRVLEVWRESVDANCDWATGSDDTTARWRGLELDRTDAVIVRAFETWIHTDDLRRVLGEPGRPPAPHHLALMADLAGRSLGASLALVGRVRPGKTARLVLTGDAGGAWSVPMDPGATATDPPDVTLTADVVDWCLLVGDRIAPSAIPHRVDGDPALAADLLAAAPALATL
jgi:uncharacterized protein (TIGR03083 family)